MSRSSTPLYREIASLLSARENCRNTNNTEWEDKHEDTLTHLVKNYLPSGSGIDCGTKLDLDASTPEKLVFTFGYHHMNDGGYYDGWTEHTMIVRPSLQFGFYLRISGRDRNGVKDYLYETYQYALTQDVWQTDDCKWHSGIYEPNVVQPE